MNKLALPDSFDALEVAYAAGLFEGEGSVMVTQGRARVAVAMTDREPIQRLQETFGGVIHGPYRPKYPNAKLRWTWYLNGWTPAEAFFRETRDWLSPRRIAQFERVLAGAPPMDRRRQGWHNSIKTHCRHGHPYNESNTYYDKHGRRSCRTCLKDAQRRYRDRHLDELRATDRARQKASYWRQKQP